jgi:DNA integrity scanning protein DisA with diadenylate cyclase activity
VIGHEFRTDIIVMNTKVPPSPDFARMDAISAETAGDRTSLLAMIGNLVFTWSNNESMFIYLLMVLLKTDMEAASITFVTLNTTRARLDLVRRLSKARVKDPVILRKVERLIERFNECTKVRNEFNHCIYRLDAKGQITHTDLLRINETKNGIEFAVTRAVDETRMKELALTVRRLKALNREIWAFLPEFEAHLGAKAAIASRPPKLN